MDEKSRLEEHVKQQIADYNDRVANLKTFDEADEINMHCDDLKSVVSLTLESQIKHLVKLETELNEQIENYRTDRQSARLTHRDKMDEKKREVEALARAGDELSSKWAQNIDQAEIKPTQEEIEQILRQANEIAFKATLLLKQFKRNVLHDKRLVFLENKEFCHSFDHVGELIDEQGLHETFVKQQKVVSLKNTFKLPATFCHQCEFISDQEIAAGSQDGAIQVWHLEIDSLQRVLIEHTSAIRNLIRLPNGCFASGSEAGDIVIWDTNEKKSLKILSSKEGLWCLKKLPNGYLASLATDCIIRIWNPYLDQNNLVKSTTRLGDNASDICFDVLSNGYLAICSPSDSSSEHSIVRIWNPQNGLVIKSFSTQWPQSPVSLLVLMDNRLAIGFPFGIVKLYDLLNESAVTTINVGHQGGTHSLAQLPNGLLLSGKYLNNQTFVEMWNPDNGQFVRSFSAGHTSAISRLTLSQDRKTLATSSWDETINIWSINLK